jgi:hypothetical protein
MLWLMFSGRTGYRGMELRAGSGEQGARSKELGAKSDPSSLPPASCIN